MLNTWLTRELGLEHPIIQGGMGPFSTNNLAAAVSNAGGLGIVSLIGMAAHHCDVTPIDPRIVFGEGTTEQYLERSLQQVKSAIDRSDGAFGVNCPVANEFVDAAGILVRGTIELREHDPELRERLRVVITSAGDPLPWADAIRATDLVWIHVVPSIYHLRRAEKAGVDAVIASGHEGGAHISWQPVHSMVLIPGVVEATPLPVIAAGGICDGRTLAAALALGAVGAQMGTRFIATRECDFWDVWKQAILDSSERETLVGRGMFGPMRFIANPASKALVEATLRHVPDFFKGLPVELRESMIEMERKGFEALAAGRGDESLILAGEVSGRIEDLPPVAELIDRIVADACEIARTLPGLVEER